jgi:hypothetical protein
VGDGDAEREFDEEDESAEDELACERAAEDFVREDVDVVFESDEIRIHA